MGSQFRGEMWIFAGWDRMIVSATEVLIIAKIIYLR